MSRPRFLLATRILLLVSSFSGLNLLPRELVDGSATQADLGFSQEALPQEVQLGGTKVDVCGWPRIYEFSATGRNADAKGIRHSILFAERFPVFNLGWLVFVLFCNGATTELLTKLQFSSRTLLKWVYAIAVYVFLVRECQLGIALAFFLPIAVSISVASVVVLRWLRILGTMICKRFAAGKQLVVTAGD